MAYICMLSHQWCMAGVTIWNTYVPQVPIAARKEIQAASYNLAAQLKAVRAACERPCTHGSPSVFQHLVQPASMCSKSLACAQPVKQQLEPSA